MARLFLDEERLRRLEEILARAGSVEEAAEEFRRLRGDPPRYIVVASEEEMLRRLGGAGSLSRS